MFSKTRCIKLLIIFVCRGIGRSSNRVFISFLNKSINLFCIPITFNNPIKAGISNKNYLITIQTRTTEIVISIFLIVNPVFYRFLKIIGVKNQLLFVQISSTPLIHEFLTFNSTLNQNKKWYENSLYYRKGKAQQNLFVLG